jgi:hypothetical protein
MTLTNCYTTLAEYKTWPDIESPDAEDDAVIEKIIKASCRYIDNEVRRTFYPRIEARLYNVPSYRSLLLDDDLLAVIGITNGDGNTLLPAEYLLDPANAYPKYAIRIKQSSSYFWATDSSANSEQVISVNGWWGYHEQYSTRAWVLVGTIAAAMADTTTLTATLTAGHSAETGQIWKIDSEILNGQVSANAITFQKRGDNGSTAATHLILAPIYAWAVQDDIKEAVIMLTSSLEKRRAGESISSETIATAAGVLITPRDVPGFVTDVIKNYERLS